MSDQEDKGQEETPETLAKLRQEIADMHEKEMQESVERNSNPSGRKDAQEVRLSIDPSQMSAEALIERNRKIKDNFQKQADSSEKIAMPTPSELEKLTLSKHESMEYSEELQALLSMMEALEAGKYNEPPKTLLSASPLEAYDLYLAYNHMFSAATKAAFKNVVSSTRPQRDVKYPPFPGVNKATDEVRQFAVICVGEEKINAAARAISKAINSLAERDYVTGVLGKLLAVKIVSEPYQLPRYIVVSYPALTQSGCQFLDDTGNNNLESRPYMVRENYLPNVRI